MEKDFLARIENIDYSRKEKIKAIYLPCFTFDLSKTSNARSGVGGFPILPVSIYPKYNGVSLEFLANISLKEVSPLNGLLPQKGSLIFFVFTGNVGYRYPYKKNEFRVFYVEDDTICFSEEESKHLYISFQENISFPSYQENTFEKNEITDYELDIIENYKLNNDLKKDYDINHQVFGHPTALQGTVRFWWSLIHHGYNMEDVENLPHAAIDQIKSEEDNFTLLLQLNFGDSRIGIDYFGDSIAYFGIHKNDLHTSNFENVILVMQNT